MNPLVSVCIPTYNASGFIKETIKSVLDSSYSNLELIVNDDCSVDDTKKLVEEFDDFAYLFQQINSFFYREHVPRFFCNILAKILPVDIFHNHIKSFVFNEIIDNTGQRVVFQPE